MNKEQANLIEIFSEERDRRDGEEEILRNKLEVPHSFNTFSPFARLIIICNAHLK